VKLYFVDFCAANLQGAILDGAEFYRADLSLANLTDASTDGTDFDSVLLQQAIT
jgi:uncharacterized protein YjbI with pentapeptide repeats